MKHLVVGLGNPGKQGTRHNFGIDAVRLFVERMQEQGKLMQDWKSESKFEADIASVSVAGQEIVCFFPTTFMNDSGRAVAAYLNFFKLPTSQLVVVHDELELPFGEIKLDSGGPARGHNGIRSIHEHIGTQEFKRLRLGIGRPSDGKPIDAYVLEQFIPEEQVIYLDTLTNATQEILELTARPPQE